MSVTDSMTMSAPALDLCELADRLAAAKPKKPPKRVEAPDITSDIKRLMGAKKGNRKARA